MFEEFYPRTTIKLVVLTLAFLLSATTVAQDESGRKVLSKVEPTYPDLARKFKIGGVVKLQVVIAPNGEVKEVRVIGGHPVLLDAATTAVKEWKYERASRQSVATVIVTFSP